MSYSKILEVKNNILLPSIHRLNNLRTQFTTSLLLLTSILRLIQHTYVLFFTLYYPSLRSFLKITVLTLSTPTLMVVN